LLWKSRGRDVGRRCRTKRLSALDRQSVTDSMPPMSQKKWFAMAAIGRDRPGIVADLSECVYACGCNLEDASMTMLGSEFATLMLVSGSGADLQEKLYEATKRLEWERHLTVFLRPVEGPGVAGTGVDYSLPAVGVD